MGKFNVRTSADGAYVIASERRLGAYPRTVCEDLVTWAARRPRAALLGERRGNAWRELAYGDALERVRSIGAGLLRAGASAEAPLGLIADNGIEHALVALAAMYVGVPVSPLSVGYAAPEASPARLREMLAALGPGLLFAGNADISTRLSSAAPAGVRVVTNLAELAGDAALADDAFARVTADTIAKIMFTSGSTGALKASSPPTACCAQTKRCARWYGRNSPSGRPSPSIGFRGVTASAEATILD